MGGGEDLPRRAPDRAPCYSGAVPSRSAPIRRAPAAFLSAAVPLAALSSGGDAFAKRAHAADSKKKKKADAPKDARKNKKASKGAHAGAMAASPAPAPQPAAVTAPPRKA